MKLGITMEGGASRTVFSCGVADALLEENIMPDYFIGVSAGIAYGVSYLSRQKGSMAADFPYDCFGIARERFAIF